MGVKGTPSGWMGLRLLVGTIDARPKSTTGERSEPRVSHTRETSRFGSDLQRHGAHEVRSRSTPRESGYYWSATTGGHVIYESRLELARLLLADFAPEVVAIAAQPFLLRAPVGGRVRRHVPDFLLVHADQTVRVVNVKPAERLADPAVAEALAWPGELFEARGWGHEIWTGADPVLLANVRFLAGYRRPGMPPDAVAGAVLDLVRAGDCLGGLLDRLEHGWPRPLAKAALLRLLWQRRVSTDLSGPLDAGSVLEVTR